MRRHQLSIVALLLLAGLPANAAGATPAAPVASIADATPAAPVASIAHAATTTRGQARRNLAGAADFAAGQAAERGVDAPLDEAAAEAAYMRAAAAGHAQAARRLGLRARWGAGRPADGDAARRWLRLAAERGDVPAARELGRLPGDEATARRWLAWAAGRGDALAAWYLSEHVWSEMLADQRRDDWQEGAASTQRLEATSLRWAKQAAAGGVEAAMERLHDNAAARPTDAWLQAAAAHGNLHALRLLAPYPLLDQVSDDERAQRVRAATQGLASAALALGKRAAGLRGDEPHDWAAARRWFAKGAQAVPSPEQAEALFWLGRMAKHGTGGPVDLPLALASFRAAAEGGQAAAREQLASFYAGPDGRLAVRDPAGSAELRPNDPATLTPAALGAIARMHLLGITTFPDEREASRWYERAGERDDPESLLWLSRHGDYERSRARRERAAQLGHLAAMSWSADALASIDPARAWAWRLALVKRRDPAGLLDAAERLASGAGVPRNLAAAREHYSQAAQAGRTAAWAPLGQLMMTGEGGPADPAGAIAAWQQGAEAGDDRCAAWAGEALVAAPATRARGLALLERAAGRGGLHASLALGGVYEAGGERARAEQVYARALAIRIPAATPDDPIATHDPAAAPDESDDYPAEVEARTVALGLRTFAAATGTPAQAPPGPGLVRRLLALRAARGDLREAEALARRTDDDARTLAAAARWLRKRQPRAVPVCSGSVDRDRGP